MKSIQAAGVATVHNKYQISGSVRGGRFNEFQVLSNSEVKKELPQADMADIVVASRVYDSGLTRHLAGFGDVAHGVRAVKCLRNKFPERSIVHVVEGAYDTSGKENNDYQIFKKITSIADVETVLINHHGQAEKVVDKACEHSEKLLRRAKVIVHGPSDVIKPVRDNPGCYSGKMVCFDEYNCSTFFQDKGEYPGMKYFNSGFPLDHQDKKTIGGMFLKASADNCSGFENELLQKYIQLPVVSSNIDKACNKEPFYFAYHNHYYSLISSIPIFHFLEGESGHDITIVASCSEEQAEELENELPLLWKLASADPDNAINKIRLFSRNGMEKEWVNDACADDGHGRTVTVLFPNGFSPDDAFLMGKYAKCTVSSGDLSMSEVFAGGRLPMVAIDCKRDNALRMLEHILKFTDKNPAYNKFYHCIKEMSIAYEKISGNIRYITSPTGKAKFDTTIREMISAFKLFGTEEWSQFEKAYIDYLYSEPGIYLEDNLCAEVKNKLNPVPPISFVPAWLCYTAQAVTDGVGWLTGLTHQ